MTVMRLQVSQAMCTTQKSKTEYDLPGYTPYATTSQDNPLDVGFPKLCTNPSRDVSEPPFDGDSDHTPSLSEP